MSASLKAQWRKPHWVRSPLLRWALYGAVLLYLYLAFISIDINYQRLSEGVGRGLRFVQAFSHPDFSSRWAEIRDGILESLAMMVTATVLGILVSVPFGLGAARNISPYGLVQVCRFVISASRALPELIIAIFLVKMFGFGPFAGMLTLVIATIGFFGKLMADEIETIQFSQIEAVRATGASWWQVLVYAVQPQIAPRLVGLSVYRLDINFRESAVIGIVGAGGIGASLNTAFNRYEFDTAAAILLLIIMIVMLCEYTSGYIRRRYL